MNALLTKERLIREVKLTKAHERFHEALEAAAAVNRLSFRRLTTSMITYFACSLSMTIAPQPIRCPCWLRYGGTMSGVLTTALRVWHSPPRFGRTCCC